MPVEQVKAPSIAEVRRDLKAYEEQYAMSTAEFQAKCGCDDRIDEDDAVEWLYRAEQLRVLEEGDARSPYARAERRELRQSNATVAELMDRLAA